MGPIYVISITCKRNISYVAERHCGEGDTVNQDVFQSLVAKLVDAIPQAIGSLKVTKPICCVRVEYYDTHAPCAYLTLRTISADLRAKFLEEEGRDASYLRA